MLLLAGASTSWLRYSNVRTREGNWFFLYSTTLIHLTFVNRRGSLQKLLQDMKKRKRWKDLVIKKWRAALTEAANLSGWDLQNVANGHESKFIKKIVEKVQDEVNQTYMNVAMHPVGIESRVESINSLLNFEYNDIRIVGIYGPGGIGKSTIAKAVYNQSYLLFEGCSFIANVKEVSKQLNGLIHIQEQILSETLKEKNFKVGNVDKGKVLMKERLRSKRVLIVLDDVDDGVQLKALAGQNDWFGPRSRIIITTRDEHLMSQAEVLWRYEVDILNEEESLELFNLHAFKTTNVPDDYLELSEGIIAYLGGLPLALEVFGGHLVERPREQWESAFKRLQQIPDNQIQEQLKISFDGLADDLKGIFLHIACFFVGMENNLARIILDGCGFCSEIGINVLREKCLLKVEGMNNELIMHNLVRDMGRAIVHQESPQKRGMRSRLWFHEDVDYVLQNDKGTEAIEGISLVLPRTEETKISSTSFARINNLQLLKMHNVHVTGSLEHLSNQLRWLCWHHYPLKCLPSIFHMEELVVLDMQYSKLNTIWKGSKVDTEHAGLPGPIRNKNISSPLFDIPATIEKKRTCSILFDIPSITENKEFLWIWLHAVYEAKTDGSVLTRISEVFDPHNASRYQCRRSCLSHFESRNRGNYYLEGDIKLENEIVGGERIEVCFEIAPSACIVVKVCLLRLSYKTCTGDYSKVNIHGRKIGFDLVETSGGLANKDYDSKRSSIIWEDVNNEEDEEDNKCIHLHSVFGGYLSIGSWNSDIYRFKKFLEFM
ncbi:hypothetical protein LguiA_030249 [Lonicera macranthoides]